MRKPSPIHSSQPRIPLPFLVTLAVPRFYPLLNAIVPLFTRRFAISPLLSFPRFFFRAVPQWRQSRWQGGSLAPTFPSLSSNLGMLPVFFTAYLFLLCAFLLHRPVASPYRFCIRLPSCDSPPFRICPSVLLHSLLGFQICTITKFH